MNKNRLKQLMEFLEKDPNDAFTIYAIATEYVSESPAKAIAYYERLLNDFPNYTATYYHAAAVYTEIGEVQKAKETYEKGLIICQKHQDTKALHELKNAYQNFLFEFDDEL